MLQDSLTQTPVVQPQINVGEEASAQSAAAQPVASAEARVRLADAVRPADALLQDSLLRDSLLRDSLLQDSLLRDSLRQDSLLALQHPAAPSGDVVGTLRPSEVREQDGVGLLTVVSFLLLTDVLCRSWKYLKRSVTDFFYPTDHNNMYDDNTPDNHLHAGLSLAAMWAATHSLACYYFYPDLPLYLWFGGALAAVVLKVGVYGFVNFTYFAPQARYHWRAGYKLLCLLQSVLVGSAAIAGIYGAMALEHVGLAMVLAVGVVKILLLIKTLRTFFKSSFQVLHFILYFCTLEIAPVVALLIFLHYLI